MYYALMLLDRADLLGEYDDLAEARGALAHLLAGEPELMDVAALVPHDDGGRPAGAPIGAGPVATSARTRNHRAP